MTKRLEISGKKFGFLTVVELTHERNHGHAVWSCNCICGNTCRVTASDLRRGFIISCGCKKLANARALGLANARHGFARHEGNNKSPTYNCWRAMIQRCAGTSPTSRKYYFDLGITVCDRWKKFENFLEDMGIRPSKAYSLDRFPDKSGNYVSGNVRWATRKEQANNTNPAGSYSIRIAAARLSNDA